MLHLFVLDYKEMCRNETITIRIIIKKKCLIRAKSRYAFSGVIMHIIELDFIILLPMLHYIVSTYTFDKTA